MTASPPRGALSLPDIVATAFGIVARNPVQFLLLAIPSALLTTAASVFASAVASQAGLTGESSNPSSSQTAALALIAVVGLVASLLGLVLGELLIVPATVDALLKRRIDVRAAITSGVRHFPAGLVIWLALCLSSLLALTFFLIPLAILLVIRLSFAVQEASVNDLTGGQALRRSAELVRGTWWRVLGVSLALVLLASLPVFLVDRALAGLSNDVVVLIFSSLAAWLATPFLAVGRTVLYADVKLRKGEQLRSAPPPGLPDLEDR